MPSFLVETYEPRVEPSSLAAIVERLRAAAAELAGEGVAVAYVETLGVPADDTCFHLVDGASPAEVGELARRAGLAGARIVEALAR